MLRIATYLAQTARDDVERGETEAIQAGFNEAFAAMETRERTPRKQAVRDAVMRLHDALSAMDARLAGKLGDAFVESLYPALTAPARGWPTTETATTTPPRADARATSRLPIGVQRRGRRGVGEAAGAASTCAHGQDERGAGSGSATTLWFMARRSLRSRLFGSGGGCGLRIDAHALANRALVMAIATSERR